MGRITLDKVTKSFGDVNVIPPLDLTINDGEFVVFVGPSGCGKSTLLRLIAGLEDVTSGQIRIDGEDATNLPPAKRKLAMVFQSYALYPHMSVRKNIAFPMKMAGVDEACRNGMIAGYPLVDCHFNILDGSSHDVDSNENAFKMAAIFAVREAMKSADPCLLEPVMAVEVTSPEEKQGDIMGDLNRRRGKITSMDSRAGMCVVKAEVPLAEMFGYSTVVRTLSSGRASYSMTPSHFEEVPQDIVANLVEQRGY